MNLNEFQQKAVKKYWLKTEDIIVQKRTIQILKDRNKTRHETAEVLHYTCKSCGQIELFGFIDKLGMKCRDCQPLTEKK